MTKPKLPPPNKTQPIPSTHNWIYAVLIVLVGVIILVSLKKGIISL